MVNYNRAIAGIFAGAGGIYLLYVGQTAAGTAILSSMLAFFVGEKNGEKRAEAKEPS